MLSPQLLNGYKYGLDVLIAECRGLGSTRLYQRRGLWGLDLCCVLVVYKLKIDAEGKGVGEYVRLAGESPLARQNLAALDAWGIAAGVLDPGRDKEQWADDAFVDNKLRLLDEFADAGLGAYHFDYFAIADTYS